MRGFTSYQIVLMMPGMSGSFALMTARALRSADLSRAQSAFMVANSPLFLLRKLREDPTVAEIAKKTRTTTILSQLRQSLSRESRTLRTAVAPYVYLVALSMQPDIKYLVHASKLSAPHHTWFSFLSDVLLKTYQPTSVTRITVSAGKKDAETRIDASANKYTISLEN
jgi:hypothetical protein